LKLRPFIAVALAMAAFALCSAGQSLPREIRGYKVHQMKVRVDPANKHGAAVSIGTPTLVSLGLTGVTIEATAEIDMIDQNGSVDFLMFKDVETNGIPLSIEDYEHGFRLRKGEKITLPAPVRATVSSVNIAKAAYKETTDSTDKWQVTGTVFVFGRFKKMGFTFKRVIPVPITLTIDNPVKAITAAAAAR